MKCRPFNPLKDYEAICVWWASWSWPRISLEALPSTGAIVEDLAAGWMYKTDSNIAWLEWVVANPNADKTQRREAVDLVIEYLIEKARDAGFSSVFTSAVHPALLEKLGNKGFEVSDRNVTHLCLSLTKEKD